MDRRDFLKKTIRGGIVVGSTLAFGGYIPDTLNDNPILEFQSTFTDQTYQKNH